MEPAKYNTWAEPEISGELVAGIERTLIKRSESWMRYWVAVENAPENQPHLPLLKRLKGKDRKLPDIKLRYAGLRETLYFRCEAKRLASTGAYTDLIGEREGLGRFLRREYGRNDIAAGLLGYVQTETPEIHAGRIEAAYTADRRRYRIAAFGTWSAAKWRNGPKLCFRTVHFRYGSSGPITIFHTFFAFT